MRRKISSFRLNIGREKSPLLLASAGLIIREAKRIKL